MKRGNFLPVAATAGLLWLGACHSDRPGTTAVTSTLAPTTTTIERCQNSIAGVILSESSPVHTTIGHPETAGKLAISLVGSALEVVNEDPAHFADMTLTDAPLFSSIIDKNTSLNKGMNWSLADPINANGYLTVFKDGETLIVSGVMGAAATANVTVQRSCG